MKTDADDGVAGVDFRRACLSTRTDELGSAPRAACLYAVWTGSGRGFLEADMGCCARSEDSENCQKPSIVIILEYDARSHMLGAIDVQLMRL